MHSPSISESERRALGALAADLDRVFGQRLLSVCAYGLDARGEGEPILALALVERLDFDDLAACAPLARGWKRQGVNVPLLLEREEFQRTLDVFPLEYGDIIDHHVVIAGADPFVGAAVSAGDLRRAIEFQAKSHLIHLREGFIETYGDPAAVSRLIAASAAPLRTLLANIGRLDGEPRTDLADGAERQIGIPAALVREVFASGSRGSVADPTELLARYIRAAERIWEFVDAWR